MKPDDGFAKRLGDAIDASRIDQKRLAKKLGTSEPTVSDWVNGKRGVQLRHLMRLPEMLGVSGHWLLTGEGPREPPDDGLVTIDGKHLKIVELSILAMMRLAVTKGFAEIRTGKPGITIRLTERDELGIAIERTTSRDEDGPPGLVPPETPPETPPDPEEEIGG